MGSGTNGAQPTQRPRRRRKEARPGEIIDAGLKEFTDKGFAASRLEDIAARAGIAKGTIYRYFESKEALFRAAVRLRILPELGEIETLIDRFPGSSEALLQAILERIYERLVASEAREIMRIIIAEGRRFPEIPGYYHREMIRNAETLLRRVLERGIAAGEFRPGAALELPVVIMAPAIVAAIWQMTFQPHRPIAVEQFLRAHLDLVMHGIKVRPG